MKRKGLKFKKLLTMGTYDASVMVGVNILETEIRVTMLAFSHSLQLSVSHAAAECLLRNLEFRIKDIFH
jgi:hypothetical protein